MDTNVFWRLRGGYDEMRRRLASADRVWLEAVLLDGVYNDFLSQWANYADGDADPHGHGKRLPYIGWFWRHLEFHSQRLPIGSTRHDRSQDHPLARMIEAGDDYVGFMASNKWDYAERMTTPEEFMCIVAIIDAAMIESQRGGELHTIREAITKKLDELWDYLQTLEV